MCEEEKTWFHLSLHAGPYKEKYRFNLFSHVEKKHNIIALIQVSNSMMDNKKEKNKNQTKATALDLQPLL